MRVQALFRSVLQCLRPPHGRMVGHLEAVRHVARKAHVENGRANALVLHDVHHLRHQGACLPGKGRARFENNAEMRIARMKSAQRTDKALHIVILSRHQVATTEVKPRHFGQQMTKLLLDVYQRMFERRSRTFAMAVAVKSFHPLGQPAFGQLRSQHTEP